MTAIATAPAPAPAPAVRTRHLTPERRRRMLLAGVGVACVVMTLVSLMVGAVTYSPADVWHAVTGSGQGEGGFVITHFHLPRMLLCWVVGIGLAVSGGVMQGVIRNPLAAPNIVGVTHGAGLAAILVVHVLPTMPSSLIPVAAFAGGQLSIVVVYAAAYRRGASPARLALVGVAVGALCNAGILFLLVRYPLNSSAALTWLAGSLYARDMSSFWQILPWVAVLVPLLLHYAHRLDTLGLGDDLAAGLGEPVERTRLITLFLSVTLASAVVASAGTIGFVGLVAPHIARRLVGGRHLTYLPVAGLVGALLMLVADTIARGADPPLELPCGLITSVIGAPYFLYLLTKTGKAGGR